MEQFAKYCMPDLLWGENETVLQDLQNNGGEYSTEIDNVKEIQEYLEVNFTE